LKKGGYFFPVWLTPKAVFLFATAKKIGQAGDKREITKTVIPDFYYTVIANTMTTFWLL
jgi:hypothetical protein